MYPEVRQNSFEISKLRWADLLDKAAQVELVRAARAGTRQSVTHIYGPVLHRVGGWLVWLGSRMQMVESPQPNSGGFTAAR